MIVSRPVIVRLKRLLLVLLVVFAVPAQGAAAASAGVCMALGHHDAAASMGDDHAVHGGSASHEGAGDSDQGSSAHCGPCLACCGAVTGVSSALAASGTFAPGGAIEVHDHPEPAGVRPGGLDRPPLAL